MRTQDTIPVLDNWVIYIIYKGQVPDREDWGESEKSRNGSSMYDSLNF